MSGTGGVAASGGSGNTGGSGGSSAGGSATGGTTASGGAGGTGGSAGTSTGGSSASGGAAGAAGSGGMTPDGGSSAKAVCEPGATYGNPLMGMGSVQEISAPQGSYFAFIEGPVWIAKLGTLFFSDNASSPAERIFKLTPPSSTPEIFLEPSGSNGLAVDNDDNLVLADQRGRRLVRVDSSTGAELETIVPMGAYKPNDLIVRSDGNIYFTDPDTGFYRVSPTGELSAAMTQVSRPNGTVLSLDENTLYVGDVSNRQIHAFPVNMDGTVNAAAGTLFVQETMNGTVDGMAVDCAGNLYAGTANGVEVYSSSGSYIGTVPTGESSNATFGGEDRQTLYVTSRSVLKSVHLAVPGLPN